MSKNIKNAFKYEHFCIICVYLQKNSTNLMFLTNVEKADTDYI
jgi:hypothetical protein